MRLCAFLILSVSAFGAPCVTATNECTEWLTFGAGPSRSLLYRTYPLDGRNEKIARAFILIHGAGRDAHNYFRTAVAAAFLGAALEDTIVISPRFASNEIPETIVRPPRRTSIAATSRTVMRFATGARCAARRARGGARAGGTRLRTSPPAPPSSRCWPRRSKSVWSAPPR